jgi:hypothetical protein
MYVPCHVSNRQSKLMMVATRDILPENRGCLPSLGPFACSILSSGLRMIKEWQKYEWRRSFFPFIIFSSCSVFKKKNYFFYHVLKITTPSHKGKEAYLGCLTSNWLSELLDQRDERREKSRQKYQHIMRAFIMSAIHQILFNFMVRVLEKPPVVLLSRIYDILWNVEVQSRIHKNTPEPWTRLIQSLTPRTIYLWSVLIL